jgi:hypothetical protein
MRLPSILSAIAAVAASAAYERRTQSGAVWVGRKRPAKIMGGRSLVRIAGGKKHAPPGYAFDGRGDLINLRKRRKYATGAA